MEISDRNAPLISVLATVGVCLSVFPIRAVADDRLSAVSTLAATLSEESPTAQRRVLHEIFAEEHIAEEALGVLLHADRLPPEQRFEYLSQWVLPSADRPTIRTSLAFTPTDPGPYHPPWLLKSDSAKPNRSGQMMAPILELIDVALELGQLDTIRAQIADAPLAVHSDGRVSNNVESSRRCALALIDAAAGRFTEAAASMEQVLQQTRSRAAAGDFHPDDALLLLLSRTWLVPELREVTAALLSCCDQWMKSPYEPTVRHRHVMAMAYQIHTQDSAQIQGSGVTDDSPVAGQWHPVSRGQDSVRGPGMPNVRWALRPGQSELVSPMNRDYLYFGLCAK